MNVNRNLLTKSFATSLIFRQVLVFLFRGQVQPRPRQASKRTLGSARSKHRFLVWEKIGDSKSWGGTENVLKKNLRCLADHQIETTNLAVLV